MIDYQTHYAFERAAIDEDAAGNPAYGVFCNAPETERAVRLAADGLIPSDDSLKARVAALVSVAALVLDQLETKETSPCQ